MRFIKTVSKQSVADYVASRLSHHLRRGERVLWLISGGSVVKVAVDVASHLHRENLDRLTVSLTDERPGPFGLKVVERRQKGAPLRSLVCGNEAGDCPTASVCSAHLHCR